MRNHLVLVTALFCLASPAHARDEAPPVVIQALTKLFPRLQAYFDELLAGDLLVLDLDNTVFREVQTLGTDEWYGHALAQLTAAGRSHREAVRELEPLNLAIKTATRMRLMEEFMPQLIRELQERKVAVIGVTARSPVLAKATLRDLAKLGVRFSKSKFPHRRLIGFSPPGLNNDFLWKGGVAFTDGSPKGLVLKALLAKSRFSPERVIAIDDRIHHVHTFVEALLDLKLQGVVVHYLRALEEPFDPLIADTQLAEFLSTGRLLSDAEARVRLCADSLRPAG